MPSPFQGMDPFIEAQAWPDFHHHLLAAIFESLIPRVRPKYVIRVEERVYVEHQPDPRAAQANAVKAVLEGWAKKGGG